MRCGANSAVRSIQSRGEPGGAAARGRAARPAAAARRASRPATTRRPSSDVELAAEHGVEQQRGGGQGLGPRPWVSSVASVRRSGLVEAGRGSTTAASRGGSGHGYLLRGGEGCILSAGAARAARRGRSERRRKGPHGRGGVAAAGDLLSRPGCSGRAERDRHGVPHRPARPAGARGRRARRDSATISVSWRNTRRAPESRSGVVTPTPSSSAVTRSSANTAARPNQPHGSSGVAASTRSAARP